MTVLSFFIAALVFGVCFYLVEKFVPLHPPFRIGIRIVAVFVLIFMLLSLFNILPLPFNLK